MHNETIHLDAIRRELAKRATAYPKILKKTKDALAIEAGQSGMTTADAILHIREGAAPLVAEQQQQIDDLQRALDIITAGGTHATEQIHATFRELQRELRMRRTCYPRWVAFHRMDADTATRETIEWEALTTYFHTTYCPEAPWRKPREKHYTHCTIRLLGGEEYLATARKSPNGWEPDQVQIDGEWIPIEQFEDSEPFNVYAVTKYRRKP